MPNACKQVFRILNSGASRMGHFRDGVRGVIIVRRFVKYHTYIGYMPDDSSWIT